jgi:hypothetical protein
MPCFLIHHRHAPQECGVAYIAFKGFASELRHERALAACDYGDHAIWWTVEAESEADALARLPHYVASRSTATRVGFVAIP